MDRSLPRRFICICIFLICLLSFASSHSEPIAKSDKAIITNRFISDKAGSLYLIFKAGLYQSFSAKGDVWSKISDGIKQVAFDPGNDNAMYAITTDNLIKKSLDKGKSLFILSPKGIYKSTDLGTKWQLASHGIDTGDIENGFTCYRMFEDPEICMISETYHRN